MAVRGGGWRFVGVSGGLWGWVAVRRGVWWFGGVRGVDVKRKLNHSCEIRISNERTLFKK